MKGLPLSEQIAHIKEFQDRFDVHQCEANADVEGYFHSYGSHHPDLYYNLCLDLDIEPRGDWSHLWEDDD